MNLANKLTLGRIFLAFLFLIFFLNNNFINFIGIQLFSSSLFSGDFTRTTTDEKESSIKHTIDRYEYFTNFDSRNLSQGFDIVQLFTMQEIPFDLYRNPGLLSSKSSIYIFERKKCIEMYRNGNFQTITIVKKMILWIL